VQVATRFADGITAGGRGVHVERSDIGIHQAARGVQIDGAYMQWLMDVPDEVSQQVRPVASDDPAYFVVDDSDDS
jgi:hypothetical protein